MKTPHFAFENSRSLISKLIKLICKPNFAVALIAILTLAGCGGSGTSAPIGGTAQFVGTWSGTYVSNGQSGTAFITIQSDGSFASTGQDNTANAAYQLVGSVKSNGTFTGTITETGTTLPIYGTWSISSAGHLVGPVTLTNGTQSTTNQYDLTKVIQ